MATASFSPPFPDPNPDPDPNSNPKFVSPMLQPYLDQLHTPNQEIQPNNDDDHQDQDPYQDPTLLPHHTNEDPSLPPDHLTTSITPSIPTLLHVSFNQDYGCFATGYDRGFRIYNCEPFNEIFRRDFDNNCVGGGIGSVEMLFRCNILALVGGGENPQYPPNKVMIWDDHQSRCIGELSFRSDVRRVRLRRDRIVVVLEQKIFVYNFVDLKLLNQIETIANPKGLCVVSQNGSVFVLVSLGLRKGEVRVENFSTKKTKFVLAHDSRIACLALTQDGQFLATASTKGTLVRVYNTHEGTLLQEVRRGADRAEIYSLAFSPTAQWLAVSSDKGTVHVFTLKINLGNLGSPSNNNSDSDVSVTSPTSSFSFIKGVLPKYFSSEWSVAQFRLPEGFQYVVAFGPEKNEGPEKHTVVILGMDGSFYKCKFDPMTRGEMVQLEYHNFLKPEAF